MSDLIEVHAATCGHERTDTLISVLGGNTAALEWALRQDLRNQKLRAEA